MPAGWTIRQGIGSLSRMGQTGRYQKHYVPWMGTMTGDDRHHGDRPVDDMLRQTPLQVGLVVLVFMLGLLSSLAGFQALNREGRQQVFQELDRHAATLARQLQTNINISLESLRTIAAFYQATGDITHGQLTDFVHSDARFHAGTLALGWVPRVPAGQRRAFEQRIRRQENPNFRIYELTGHGMPVDPRETGDSYPIQALISLPDHNLKEGLNLSSVPSRRRILERAAQRHDLAVSKRLFLYTQDGERYIVQAYYPVYNRGPGPRRLMGYAMGIFDIDAFARDALRQNGRSLGFTLLDLDAPPPEQLLYSSLSVRADPVTDSSAMPPRQGPVWRHRIRIGDRHWQLSAFPLGGVLATPPSWLPWGGLIGGLSLTAMLTLYLLLAQMRANRLLKLENDLGDSRIELTVQRRLKEAAEQSDRAKTRLLRAASHDLRQPLNAISLLGSLLRDTGLEEQRQDIIRRMQLAVAGMREMFDDLLDINRLETGEMPMARRRFPVQQILDRMESEFTTQAAEKGLSLRVHPCRVVIDSDPRLLERVLRNLLTNAIRYTPGGRVVLGCRRRGRHLRILVLDTGIGIPEADSEAVFGEFYRSDNAERVSHCGLGLGLSIVRQITALLGHELGVRSVIGQGSGFYFDAPIVQAAVPGIGGEGSNTECCPGP